ncbi:MAG TPA: nucleotidyl transferase AbiEii/AbiGii toxin family protein [Saprospiraceae bacterium]|nr:nucleotidyl transferase AbiEii/AbiGii toxin family protein [Saprospiraceae bacterium]
MNKITDEIVIEILKTIVPLLNRQGIDYFIIGAFARDIELLVRGYSEPPERKTKDIDLAVMVGSLSEFQVLRAVIATLPEFEQDEKEPYRFLFRKRYELDLLPFGEITDEKGRAELLANKTFTLEMPGFDAVFPFAETVETEEGITLRVSSLSGIVLLKLLAWQDRPERIKDIRDIDNILKHFYLLHIEEIIQNSGDLIDLYNEKDVVFVESVSAHYVGRQINEMLQNDPGLRDRLLRFLEKQSTGFEMARLMSPENIEDSQKIIAALYRGLKE